MSKAETMIPQKGETEPQLRFEGFSGAWIKKSLEMITNRYDNLRVPITASDRIPGLTPYYGANGIQDYVDGFTHDGEFVLLAEDGANDLMNYPVRYVTGKIWVNNHAHVLSVKNGKADNRFLSYALRTINMIPYLVGGSRAKLNANVMMGIMIKIPTLEEQAKIGEFFQVLDARIEVETKKLNHYESLKKAMLQKMFPQKGETEPQLRFEGFSGEWKRKTLLEVAKYRNGKAHESDVVEQGQYVIVNSKYISTDGKVKKFTNKPIEPLKRGEIAIVLSDVPNGKALSKAYLVPKDNRYTLNQRIAGITPKKDVDAYFLYILISRNTYFLKFDNGVGQTNLSIKDMERFSGQYPTLEEQTKIGEFFQALDARIEAETKKLNHYESLKKAMLQRMFV